MGDTESVNRRLKNINKKGITACLKEAKAKGFKKVPFKVISFHFFTLSIVIYSFDFIA